MPKCPILTSSAKISANTRLVTREDLDLKISSRKKTSADAVREKGKRNKDSTDAQKADE